MSIGAFLAAKRGERGLTLQQAASAAHSRVEHLSALEADEPESISAPVYARGYLRIYARNLGLDAESLVSRLPSSAQDPRKNLALGMMGARRRSILTGPVAAGTGLLLLAGAFTAYAWRQIQSDQRGTIVWVQATPAVVSPPTTPLPSQSPSSHTSS